MATKKGISEGFKGGGKKPGGKGMPANFSKGGKSGAKGGAIAGGKK